MLEAELKRLEAEYNQFFAGRLPRLPWDQRARVDAMMKRFDRMVIQNTGIGSASRPCSRAGRRSPSSGNGS